jgi:hypothetical protein
MCPEDWPPQRLWCFHPSFMHPKPNLRLNHPPRVIVRGGRPSTTSKPSQFADRPFHIGNYHTAVPTSLEVLAHLLSLGGAELTVHVSEQNLLFEMKV